MTKKNTAATVATIIVAVLAIAAVLFLLYRMSQEHTEETSSPFIPEEEVQAEMNMNADRLVRNNYSVFSLYLIGVSREKEPYDNKPEDGLYTVISKDFTSVEQIEKLVKETYVEKEADRILNNFNGDGVTIFRERKIEGNTVLGVDAGMIDKDGKYKSIDYPYSWKHAIISLEPVSNTECKLTIKLSLKEDETSDTSGTDNASADTSTSSSPSGSAAAKSISATMIKANGAWYLDKLSY